MQKLYEGKTKDVFRIAEDDGIGHIGKFVMTFKDSSTGYILNEGTPEEQVVFNPGYDRVVGQIPGKGLVDRQATSYFFSLLKENGIQTHFIDDLDERSIIVEPAILFSLKNEAPEFEGSDNLNNLEVVFRRKYFGSLWRRHPYKKPGTALDNLVEIYAKGLPDGKDELMRDETLIQLGIMEPHEIQEVKTLTRDVADVLAKEFEKKELHLVDGKIEVGRKEADGGIIVIDELSTSVLRACKGYQPSSEGNCMVYESCIETSRKDGKITIEGKNILTADQIAEAFGFKHD